MSSSSETEVLITGANGLLGHELLYRLPGDKYRIHAIVRGEARDPIDDVEYIDIDFSETWSETRLPSSPDIIIHLAQSAQFRNFPQRALDIFKVNVDTTARLLDFAYRNKVKGFIYASSGGIYGSGQNAFKENSPITPIEHLGYYLGSKMCGETLAQSYSKLFDVKVIRPFFMYGQRQNRDMLIPRLVDTIRAGRKITLNGENGIRTNPVHVSDAAKAILAMLEVKGSVTMNLAGTEVMSLREIGDCIGNHLGVKPEYEIKPVKADDLIGDVSEMLKLHAGDPVSFDQAIREMI